MAKIRKDYIDEEGKRYGRLRVLSIDYGNRKGGHLHWICLCDCGTMCSVTGGNMRRGHTQSCGCLRKEAARRNIHLNGNAPYNMRKKIDALEDALRDMLEVQDMLMPGVKHIAVKDYALLNDAPLTARRLLDG
jgi:hypothetical protein